MIQEKYTTVTYDSHFPKYSYTCPAGANDGTRVQQVSWSYSDIDPLRGKLGDEGGTIVVSIGATGTGSTKGGREPASFDLD